jgi:UTP:GlnB (protein PII) uridylyltransferase
LYLLTCADIAGTSPKLWNAWKDRLLADLHTAARLALRRGLEHPVAAERTSPPRPAPPRARCWRRCRRGRCRHARPCSRACRATTSCAAGRTQIAWQALQARCTPRRASSGVGVR